MSAPDDGLWHHGDTIMRYALRAAASAAAEI
jgi:hypothetical protein